MKSFYLIVSLRLALFPLVFNLSFAQEVEVDSEEIDSSLTEVVIPENDISMDSSLCSEWEDNVEQPLSPSDSSPSREQNHESENFSPRDWKSHKSPLPGGDLEGAMGSGEAEGVSGNIPVDISVHSEWQDKTEPVISNESEKSTEQVESDTVIDSSSQAPHNYSLLSSWTEVVVSESDTPMDSSLRSEWQVTTQDFLQYTSWLNNLELQSEEIPKLKITEVFRLWNKERIEVTNLSYEKFSWELIFSWANSKSENHPKITAEIPWYTSVIFWNCLDS